MSDKQYFAHPFLNNSGLTKFEGGTSWGNKEKYFKFGTLTHAAILQWERLDVLQQTIDGEPAEDMPLALKMRGAFYDNVNCRMFRKHCETEVEMYKPQVEFEYEGLKFFLDIKMKYDLWLRQAGYGGDIKTTSAESREEFLEHIDHYNYDRGRVFYSKGSGSIKDIIIGISKANLQIFIVVMNKGDALWKRGEEKLNELAYKYWLNNLPF